TETTVVATHGRVEETGEGLPAIGRPVPYLRIAIRDDAQRPLPAGAEGEIWIAGAALARGYRHEPGLTAERFRVLSSPGGRERSYRTGDRGRWRPDGELDFLGRCDRQVKIRGWRIEPAEIEQQLLGHPAVAAAVIEPAAGGGDTAVSEPRLTAFLVARNAEQPGLAALRAYLRTRLPDAMLPSEVRWLGQLPRTAQGKWDRAALALAASAAADAPTGLAAGVASDENPTARALAAILAEVLGVAKVGAEEDFFLLGGHSLLGVQLVARVREDLGIVLPLRTIFDHPTAAQLAAEIDRRRAPAAAPDSPPLAPGDGRQGVAA
ncbi:MAG: non-ribosomal peptide synthetase, partial [Terriglobales bacterium]